MAALYEVEKFTGVSLSDLFDEIQTDPSVMLRLCYLGLKYGADEAGKKFDMTYSGFVTMSHEQREIQEELAGMVVEDIKIIVELENEKIRLNEEKSKSPEAKKKKTSGPTTSD